MLIKSESAKGAETVLLRQIGPMQHHKESCGRISRIGYMVGQA